MANNWLTSWFGNDRSARTRNRTRLGVEVMEDREVPAIFTVTSDGAPNGPIGNGPTTLSAAILAANASPGLDTINFSLNPIIDIDDGVTPRYARRSIVVPVGGLPAITDPVIIDGTPTTFLGLPNGNTNYGIVEFDALAPLSKGTPGIVIDVGTVNGVTTSLRNLDVGGGHVIPSFWSSKGGGLFILGVAGGFKGSGIIVSLTGRAVITGNSVSGNGVAPATFITANGGGPGTYTYKGVGGVIKTVNSYGDGITIFGGGNNNGTNVGGTNAGENMVIGGNQFNGVRIEGSTASFNQIHQSRITGNGDRGVFIVDAPDNLVGDPVAAPLGGNIIVSNTRDGVYILSTDANLFAARNRVQGNTIGGLGVLLNGANGVRVESAPNTLIGGTQAAAGNVISGNVENGVFALNATTTGLIIQRNSIGPGVANQLDGVLIEGAPGVLIGGANTAQNNISNNTRIGIEVKGTSKNISIINNTITGNVREGVVIDGSGGATNHQIGGNAPNTGNVISGNGFSGILLEFGANNTNIQGNTINNNTREGIIIDSTSNILIGGPQADARNKIGGNRNGVIIRNASSNVTLQNNVIGNAFGSGPGSEDGVVVDASNTVLIGTAITTGGNIIAGNRNGVFITNGASIVSIFNNHIGIDTASVNTQDGILIDNVPNVLIGGPATLQRNIISANARAGIHLVGPSTIGTVIQNNYIGLTASGAFGQGNGENGIRLEQGASSNIIGGKNSNESNYIASNGINGVRIESGSNSNIVQGNFIGVDALTKSKAFGNGATGVYIDSSFNNLIGGTFKDTTKNQNEGNTIANSALNGVAVLDTLLTGATGNSILGNSIFANGALGIDLGDDLGLVTLNDDTDPDFGANNLQNFPEILAAETGSIATLVSGKFNSTPNRTFRLEFFSDTIANPNGSPPGYGQGRTFLGFMNVTTDNLGNALYNFFSPVALAAGNFATATATDTLTGDTSEMALAVAEVDAKGSISGEKFNDMNGNGIKDPTEPGLPNWEIDLDFQNNGTIDAKATTDANGNYSFTRLTDGTYKLTEVLQKGWVQTNPLDAVSKTGTFRLVQITGELAVNNVDFGNFQLISISGNKFEDVNGNGKQDAGEGPLANVTMNLFQITGPNTKKLLAQTVTDISGNYIFQNIGPLTGPLAKTLGPFTLQVTEIAVNMTQTTPTPAPFTIVSGQDVTGLNFGNKKSTVPPIPPGQGSGNVTIIAGADAGSAPLVRVFASATPNAQQFSFMAYDVRFAGGVRVAKGDVNGDGVNDIITAPGPGGGPHIKVFDGNTGLLIRSFFAYNPAFTGGVYVGAGDVNGDGADDIITGAGENGGPHVKVFDGKSGIELFSFFAYNPAFVGGVRVAGGDVNNDKFADIITGAGPGGGPHVRIFSGVTFGQPVPPTEIRGFMAYDPAFIGGIYVSSGLLNGDTFSDIITGPGRGGGPEVRAFDGATNTLLLDFSAYQPPGGGPPPSLYNGDSQFATGTRVAVADINGDGLDDIVTGLGAFNQSLVKGFSGTNATFLTQFLAFDPAFLGGVFVG